MVRTPPREFQLPDLDVVHNEYDDRDYNIGLEVPEFTARCPRTGQPDFATIEVSYVPDKHLVELKSFKIYIQGFRDLGIFHEDAINRILDDLRGALRPRRLEVIGRFNVRGGITTTVTSNYVGEQ